MFQITYICVKISLSFRPLSDSIWVKLKFIINIEHVRPSTWNQFFISAHWVFEFDRPAIEEAQCIMIFITIEEAQCIMIFRTIEEAKDMILMIISVVWRHPPR